MINNSISQGLKRAYLELEGVNYNAVHYRQNRNRYQNMIEAVLPLSKSGKILDIGAGFCYLTKFFKFQGYEVYAIDFFYGDLPKIRCEQNHIPFFYLNIEVDDLPFGKEFFDAIILGEVIEHFTYTPRIPLRKIKKVLKKDGILILTTPNIFRIFELLRILSGYNLYNNLISPYREKPIWYRGKRFYYRHNKLYSMKALRQTLMQSGFRIISSGYVNEEISIKENTIKVLIKWIISPLTLVFPQLRDFIWIRAKKRV
jgi:2-polyprenyl-3-methyl-5-hydroxy-6-metoxy-1,4-benzoquinol methylase